MIQRRCANRRCRRTVPQGARTCRACGSRESRWVARYAGLDRKEHGRSFSRKSDAERFLHNQEVRKARRDWVDPALAEQPFAEYVGDWWATTTHLRPSSRARVEGILRHHLLPRFGTAPLSAIQPTDIRAFVADLVGAGLAPATVRKVYNVLGSIFGSVETAGILGRSPCIGVSLPGMGSGAEQRFLSPEELARLADSHPDRYRAAVLVGGYGGLRFGEVAGMSAERFDALRSRLTVLDSITEVGGHLHRGPTKTGRGRVVSLPRFISEALAPYMSVFPPGAEGLIFTAPEGGPLRRTRFRERVWIQAVEAAGLDPLRFHDLRHTAAALAIKAGAHPKAIQERLGHRASPRRSTSTGTCSRSSTRSSRSASTLWPEPCTNRDQSGTTTGPPSSVPL
jgi:integrase